MARRNKVYSDPLLWVQHGKKGMLVNYFLVWWPLVLSSYIDRLKTQKKRDQWHGIFVGDALKVLADMVTFFGWDKLGYPLVIPVNRTEEPRLRIAEYSKADKDRWV